MNQLQLNGEKMKSLFLIKVGEISLKGGNRPFFEKTLKKNIKRKLKGYKIQVTGKNGRFYLSAEDVDDKIIKKALGTTFGIVAFSKTLKLDRDINTIREASITLCNPIIQKQPNGTFKVNVRRPNKSFPLSSYETACHVADAILEEFPTTSVNVKKPDWALNIEIREKAYIYGPQFKGPGGLPVGSAGKGILLLSGGIDSPVAGYLMAKRGLKLDAVYFHAYPYTSDEARMKVEKLAEIISPYLCGINLFVIPFTDSQLRIKEKGRTEEVTLLMRACMVKIADKIIKERYGACLVTGESLSQVASQTMESIKYTGSVSDLPIFRPLIGLDKEEIITIAKRINTYETSILPFEDCCTIFSPEHPLVRPDTGKLKESFLKLDIEEHLNKAVEKADRVFKPILL